MSDRVQSRIAGVVLIAFGLAAVVWAWHAAHTPGAIQPRVTMLGPFLIAYGLWAVIEGPNLPVKKLSLFGWVCTVLGLAAGLLYHYFIRKG